MWKRFVVAGVCNVIFVAGLRDVIFVCWASLEATGATEIHERPRGATQGHGRPREATRSHGGGTRGDGDEDDDDWIKL